MHVQPGAKRSAIAGLHGGRLKVRVAAPAIEGRANEALEAFLAEHLRVPKSAIRVVKGERSRDKCVAVNAPGVCLARLLPEA